MKKKHINGAQNCLHRPNKLSFIAQSQPLAAVAQLQLLLHCRSLPTHFL